jgi:hypothetical protein
MTGGDGGAARASLPLAPAPIALSDGALWSSGSRADSPRPGYRIECRNADDGPPAYRDVTYHLDGRGFHRRMDHDPGTRVRIKATLAVITLTVAVTAADRRSLRRGSSAIQRPALA